MLPLSLLLPVSTLHLLRCLGLLLHMPLRYQLSWSLVLLLLLRG